VPGPQRRSAGGVLLVLGLVACAGVALLLLADKPSAPASAKAREPEVQEMRPSGAAAAPRPAAPQRSAAPASAEGAPSPLSCPAKSARLPPGVESVTLQIRSAPDGALVRAQWAGGGCKAGVSPLELEVPKGAQVRLLLRAQGVADHEVEVTADSSRLVVESLVE
jgi:hypothetical protein